MIYLFDIHSVTKIGIEGCKEVFEGKKEQKFMSDHIMKTIIKELKKRTLDDDQTQLNKEKVQTNPQI